MQQFTIGPDQAGQRFDKYLRRILPAATDGFLYKMLRKKNITLNGKKAEGKEPVKSGDEVTLFLSEETFTKFGGRLPVGGANSRNVTLPPGANTDDSSLHFSDSLLRSGSKASGTGAPGKPHPMSQDRFDGRLQEYGRAYAHLKGVRVLYEDEHVLILDKPAGILSQKSAPGEESLNEWMIGYLLEKGAVTEESLALFKPSVCNRLDRNTGGLVLCGKSLAGSQQLSSLLRERGLGKYYRTLVVGRIEEEAEIQGYLVKEEASNQVRILQSDSPNIHTAYTPLRTYPGHDCTYLEVKLITGKAHQIRAHLASIGHPVIGDGKYGEEKVNLEYRNSFGVRSQLLHACRLEFPVLEGVLSPLSEKRITSPLPRRFRETLEALKELEGE